MMMVMVIPSEIIPPVSVRYFPASSYLSISVEKNRS
jgi:hypothetical protein